MPILHQYDYLMAFGTMFSLLDAFNIGANDVANSFATSVSSKSLTLRQAAFLAAICEFLGSVLVGARVASTIKNGIISASVFQGHADVQLLAFTCAITASATWLMIATKQSWPVSTTYSIISALIGVGIATGGAKTVQWGWNDGKGVATIFAGFIIAPGIAAVFGAIVYLLTKYIVLVRKNSVRAALIASPVYFFTVACVLTMSIIYKGSPQLKLDKLPENTITAGIVGTGAVVAALSAIFWLPFVYARVVKKDYTIRWYHFFMGPLLWSRAAPADVDDHSAVPDYTIHKEADHDVHGVTSDTSSAEPKEKDLEDGRTQPEIARPSPLANEVEGTRSGFTPLHPDQSWFAPANLWIILRYRIVETLTHGLNVDIHALQSGAGGSKEADRMAEMHRCAVQYDNKTEHLYSFLQVMTACTASFAHGANDLANAVGPWATIYYVWSTGLLAGKSTPTPVWLIAVAAIALVIGLATYGYNIMKALGNKLTLHSPSRGFSMELGSAITVILASQYGIPVSTTMCITGATLGVGLCNGDWRAFNWKALGWIFAGWILTVPVAALSAGCLMGLLLNAPSL
ncbi:putative sodium:inorganic phosphate symporter [Mycena belliarum]|uniref:Phosphate transporter n=1 Tax=Mycena belliarum TaxID=1033014 RepID=A0AAD6UII4_9AGAR|nr:putative sodium:inorganic phosphate symporter [Mycena belliae]